MLVLITYEIDPTSNYESLYNYLKGYKVWWHYLRNTWIVGNDNNESIDIVEICKKIKSYLQKNDKVFINEIDSRQCDGWLSTNAWDWLKNQEVNSRILT